MKDIKSTGRDIETGTKKRLRGIDGTSLKDAVENTGDEVRKDLGNAGDRIRDGVGDARDALRHDVRRGRAVRDNR